MANSLRPIDTIWYHRNSLTIVQVMACCRTAPSHYQNQCYSARSCGICLRAKSQELLKIPVLDLSLKITNLRLLPHFPRANKLTWFNSKFETNEIMWVKKISSLVQANKMGIGCSYPVEMGFDHGHTGRTKSIWNKGVGKRWTMLSFLVLTPDYSERTRSILWLLMLGSLCSQVINNHSINYGGHMDPYLPRAWISTSCTILELTNG